MEVEVVVDTAEWKLLVRLHRVRASCVYFWTEICLHQAGPCGGVQASQAGIPSTLTSALCCSFQGFGGFIPGDNAHSKH